MAGPLKLAFIGNCQVQTYLYLAELMLPGAQTRSFDFSLASSREQASQDAFFGRLDEADWILAQPNVFDFARAEVLRARHGSRVVIIPNFYFRGFFPDACYVGAFGHRLDQPTSYNSLVVLDAFTRGLSEAEAVASFCPSNYMRLGLFDGWMSSFDEMVHRDAEVDLPGAPLLERFAREMQCFHTINHPTAFLLKAYLGQLFDRLGLPWHDVESRELRDPLTDLEQLPVADEIAEHFGLPFRTTQRWKLGYPQFRFVDRAGFVAEFYDSYRRAPEGTLKIHSPRDMVRSLRARDDLSHLAADPD